MIDLISNLLTMKNSTLPRIFLICCLCCTLTIARAQYVAIPDVNFGNWLNANGYASCMTGSSGSGWQLNTACAAASPDSVMDCSGSNISDLTGIEYFTNLQNL